MKNKDIYDRALSLLGETSVDGIQTGTSDISANSYTADYRVRAPYLIALIVSELSPLEAILDDSDAPETKTTPAALTDDLQVDSRFADAIASRLAGLLVLNESRERADALFDIYKTQMNAVRAALTSHDRIKEVCYQ